MIEIKARDNRCEKCSRFSHCNNNELVCTEKFWEVKQLLEQSNSALLAIKELLDNNVWIPPYRVYDIIESVLGDTDVR